MSRRNRGVARRVTWSCCSLLVRSRLGGGEREEQLFQPGCLRLTQLGEEHLVVARDARVVLCLPPVSGGVYGYRITGAGFVVDPRKLQSRGKCLGVGAAHEDRGACEQ